jgi:DNA-binding transcriptional MerR regulator
MERIYAISEVTTLIGINESTLRNWEREFADYLAVSRDSQGARIYT